MLFLLNFPAEPPTLQYAVAGLLTCGVYLLVTRGRALRRPASQPLEDAGFAPVETQPLDEERRAA